MSTNLWKDRLYDVYVSSGQAAPRTVGGDRSTADEILRPHAPHVTRFIARHIPADRRARIVDLGCGDGILLHFLARAGYQDIIGLEQYVADLTIERVPDADHWIVHQKPDLVNQRIRSFL